VGPVSRQPLAEVAPRGGRGILLDVNKRTGVMLSKRSHEQAAPSLPDSLRFGRAICGDLAQAERREWWLANGLGAYAAGTVAGSLTRRYHGLLVAPVNPPLGRVLVLAKADATLAEGERAWPLHTNRWGSGAVTPKGYLRIESFRLDGRMPVWRYAVGEGWVEQRIWMEHGANRTYVAWRFEPLDPGDRRVRVLRVRLLANARDHHGSARPGHFDPVVEVEGGHLSMSVPGAFALHIRVPAGKLRPEKTWVESFDLPVERERGLDAADNHLGIAEAELPLEAGEWTGLAACLEDRAAPELVAAMTRALERDQAVLAQALDAEPAYAKAPDWVRRLVLAADDFVFARPLPDAPQGESVIAGYPWFGDWGRDTMIALPGLTLATGRPESARNILETFARFVDQGMLPNVFPGAGETPDYNTVDAALWYFEAWRAYVEVTGDAAILQKVFPTLEAMVNWHLRGTRYGIRVDPADGLLRAGAPGVQLTWMDAKVGDWVVTPRIGKPVEINALWINALRIMGGFATRLGKGEDPYAGLADRVEAAFQRFVKPDGGLLDLLDGPQGDDPTVRPNQIFAVSLPHSPLSPEQQARVVGECARELYTTYGLRSLAPSDPHYRPHYVGGVWERDGAYHQGPVWGWLLGHFALAVYRVHGDAGATLALLSPVAEHLRDAALGTVSEIFDGAAPHLPRGAPAQAWSVACILDAWWRLTKSDQ
jgi:predicted glycogen debranching enzyme